MSGPLERATGFGARFLAVIFFFFLGATFFFFAFDFEAAFFFFLAPADFNFLIFSLSLRTRLSKASIFFWVFDIVYSPLFDDLRLAAAADQNYIANHFSYDSFMTNMGMPALSFAAGSLPSGAVMNSVPEPVLNFLQDSSRPVRRKTLGRAFARLVSLRNGFVRRRRSSRFARTLAIRGYLKSAVRP